MPSDAHIKSIHEDLVKAYIHSSSQENKLEKERKNSPKPKDDILPWFGSRDIMSPLWVLFWAKCIQTMDEFVSSNDGPMLELAAHIPGKAMYPVLRVEKKMACS